MKDIQTSIELGVDLMKDIVAAGYSFLKEKNKDRDFFGAATKKYVCGLLERNSTIKVLTMREPQPLEKLYVRANILKDKITAELGLSAEELEKFHDLDRRTFGKIAETVDGELIVNQLQRFIVLGKPGAGKTTYLRYLTLMMLQPLSQIEQRKLPIFVTLREWADKKMPLLDFITEQFDICGFEEARPFVERVLTSGDCIVLFDGMDEVSQEANQSGIIQQIKDFSDKYSENQFVISCRVAAYNRWFERFTDVEMADFNDRQIEVFIRNWFQGQPKAASDCWEQIKASPQLRELASVPLLLTLLCLAYDPEKKAFPQKRSAVYRDAIKILLEQWDENRPGGRVKRDEIYKTLSRQNKVAMFARIAWGAFTENQYFIEEEQLGRIIQNFIKNLPEYQDEKFLPDGERILKQIEAQHGVLVERAKGVYSFAHLTFQEYFTAKCIVDNAREGTLETLVNEHLYDDKWREVFLLVAMMLDNADELLWKIFQKINELKAILAVNDLLVAVDAALLPSEGVYPVVVRQSTAIAFSLNNTLAEDYNFFAPLMDISFDDEKWDSVGIIHDSINCSLDIASTTDKNFKESGAYMVAGIRGRFVGDTLDDLGLDIRKTRSFSEGFNPDVEDAKLIMKYLKRILLIVQCLQSGAFVSKPVREKILNEMLMPRKGGGVTK